MRRRRKGERRVRDGGREGKRERAHRSVPKAPKAQNLPRQSVLKVSPCVSAALQQTTREENALLKNLTVAQTLTDTVFLPVSCWWVWEGPRESGP